ncbi:MAG: hypothetical protein NW241_13315 [Bacteroidia bacterium]|nr:hypothetical protein [Bacteroidia bacterium]
MEQGLRTGATALLLGMAWLMQAAVLPEHPAGLLLALLMLGTIAAGWLPPSRMRAIALLPASAAILALTLRRWSDSGYEWPQLIEHSLRIATLPLLAWLSLPGSRPPVLALRLALAGTFAGHGIYALGWPFPTPPQFLSMTARLLHLTPPAAQEFLFGIGLADLAAAMLLFTRRPRPALIYMVLWGSLTALARAAAHLHAHSTWEEVLYWSAETLIRVPHACAPLILLLAFTPQPRPAHASA